MKEFRDSFYEELNKGLVGPGSDTFGVNEEEELISDFPLNRYYSGIIFPEKSFESKLSKSEEEIESNSNIAETDEDNFDSQKLYESNEAEEIDKNYQEDVSQYSDSQDYNLNQNAFYTTHIGLTICIKSKDSLKANFSFGIYDQLELPMAEIKVAISKEGFESFFDPDIQSQISFKDALAFSDNFMYLTRKLNGSSGGKVPRSGEYKDFDNFKRKSNIGGKDAYLYVHLLEKLLGRVWKRQYIEIKKEISVENTEKPVEIYCKEYSSHKLSVAYMTKVYEHKKNIYVKVLLLNTSNHPSIKFSNTNEFLNRKCLFQSKISIEGNSFKPYKSQSELHPFDEEQNEINFIYRDIKSYGVGHNCSVQWNLDELKNIILIWTTFMPEKIIYGMKNDFSKNDFPDDFDALNKCLEIKQLSHFNSDKRTIIESLTKFLSLYEKWIKTEENKTLLLTHKEKEISEKLINRQIKNLKRLERGVEILQSDKKVFKCFQLVNTAMFIQMIISNDNRFGKSERNLTEEITEANYDSLEFFEHYKDWDFLNPDSFEPPRYRPFQLAFLLLSIEGIIDETSDDRNIVDLIWFPTGGGKTEAYLTVVAFTILWRRLSNNEQNSKGTSIIMRYTLRLLTSQQFERASRLILALEFIRRNFEELHKENISIGLWVGESASPNKIEDTHEIIEKATEDYEKAEQFTGRLQLTACPWCGTKLVTKTINGIWNCGYDSQGGKKGYFYFNCVNNKCAFHDRLPIQVVDEMLYNQPPTLLFATVDKFAILASQKDGETHKFFNSFSNALPPDLIIQDELHLISGPLGSIVGVFESIIELLCKRGNRLPKIISSTATIRNTIHQINELYGRDVNLFPPSGICYSDSFFAKETKSKRKYVGFLPTGKTGVSTQLWIIPYLLFTRLKFYNETNSSFLNFYWTIVSYYNSLKDVGKIYNKTNDEIQINTNVLFYRKYGNNSESKFLIRDIDSRSIELTSRIDGTGIKSTLKRLEENFEINTSLKGNEYVKDGLDLILASNMVSVGIDVSRLNVMLINSMPRNIAEYIQASSRVGRKYDGIVLTLFNPINARDKSYFENFISFHEAYYKFIEPLSITPFTENTIKKMLTTMFIAYIRNGVEGLSKNSEAKNFKPELAEPFRNYINNRFGSSKYFDKLLDDLISSWCNKNSRISNLTYATLMRRSPSDQSSEELWLTMNSLREIDTETYFSINDLTSN